jgi:hypothetical protein
MTTLANRQIDLGDFPMHASQQEGTIQGVWSLTRAIGMTESTVKAH